MPMKSATDISAKIMRNWDPDEWIKGIQRQDGSPTAKAAAKADKWEENTVAAKQLFIDRCNETTLQDVVAGAEAKKTHYGNAKQRAADGFAQVWAAGLGQAVEDVKRQVAAVENNSDADAKRRMEINFDGMKALRGKFRRKGRRR